MNAKGPPLHLPPIGHWVPYCVGHCYPREVYELFLYDGTTIPAMYPNPSLFTPNMAEWAFIGSTLNDTIKPYFNPTDNGYYIVPDSRIVALRLMPDEEISRYGVVWDTGITRQQKMKECFTLQTDTRRYTIKEIRSLAKSIEYAIFNNPKPHAVLNILKISLRDVIDK